MKFWKEFKAFISRGNILDLAVGVIIDFIRRCIFGLFKGKKN